MSTKRIDFPAALRSFTGYLEGTGKAAHTISSYRSDLLAFESYLDGTELASLSGHDLERYHGALKAEGLKTNTRRRRLITVRRFLRFLAQRNKLPEEVGLHLIAPGKLERVPRTVPLDDLVKKVRDLPSDSPEAARSRVLLWTLAETGARASEVVALKFEDWRTDSVSFGGKAPRLVRVHPQLCAAVQKLKAGKSERLFVGFNRFGPLGASLTVRGVELIVHHYAERLGFSKLTPRTIRHSVIAGWLAAGIPGAEVVTRLGLKSEYALRAHAKAVAPSA